MKRIDKISGGLAGKILRVNLSNKRISTEDTEKYARRWLGGRAIASWILLDETAPGTKWSDPESMLIFSAGCLNGTSAPAACRTSVDSINAFNNGKGSANFGGHFGAELKYAGFDHVVITGKSVTPVYLWIHDREVEIRDASLIWGKTNHETEEILQRELGDDRVRTASIGPAGENLVRGSAILGDTGQVGGGSGVGCVMGSKKLKALAVRGHGSIKVAEPNKFLKAVDSALAKIEKSPLITGEGPMDSFRKGIIASFKMAEVPWSFPIRNAQDFFFSAERAAKLLGKDTGVQKYFTKMWSCFDCPIGCQPFVEINEGKYKGTKGFTYWANSAMYSMRLDSDDPAVSAKFHLLCNQLGLDGDTTTVVTAWAFECYEKGLLTKQDTDGLELKWGNDDAWIKLVEKIAYREGFGDLLADGVLEASRKLGKGSEKFIAHCKGQDTVEGFGGASWALAVSTSPVAGHHLRGAAMAGLSGPPDLVVEPGSIKNIPELVFWQLQAKEIEDLAGFCVFVEWTGAHALLPTDFVEIINPALGIDLTEGELMRIGEASYNLEKAFNTLHTDLDRKDDYPPERFMREIVKSGPMAGTKVERERQDKLLDRFYELLGWDKATSWQSRKNLTELGLDDVAMKLEKAGKLID